MLGPFGIYHIETPQAPSEAVIAWGDGPVPGRSRLNDIDYGKPLFMSCASRPALVGSQWPVPTGFYPLQRALFRGMPTGLKAFLERQAVQGLRPCAWFMQLKKKLCAIFVRTWDARQIPRGWPPVTRLFSSPITLPIRHEERLCKLKCKQPHPELELGSTSLFSATIIDTTTRDFSKIIVYSKISIKV